MNDILLVNEVYGPAHQGEGHTLNKRVIFIRLATCNLACEFCDAAHTWNWKNTKYVNTKKFDPKVEILRMSCSDILKRVIELDGSEYPARSCNAVVISGGEPLLQQRKLIPLLQMLKQLNFWIEIETNGTIAPSDEFLQYIDQINCSPKLSTSGPDNPESRRIVPEALQKIRDFKDGYFKFVVCNDSDLLEIWGIVDQFKVAQDHVYLMPEGETLEKQVANAARVETIADMNGFEYSPRLHIYTHGNKRGV